MTIVLTNDDGIDAPGIRSLKRAVSEAASQQAIVVAPKLPHSGCGHQVTTHRGIHVERRFPPGETAEQPDREIAIEGTPADCTRIAVTQLFSPVDWVISGINAGGNLGADVYISGTVAAVREAAFHRIPGIAISHYIHRRRAIDWALAERLTVRVLEKLMSLPLELGTFWNVNLPHLEAGMPEPEIVFCPLCTQPLPTSYRQEGEYLYYAGDYSQRDRDADSDVAVCFDGQIAVSQIRV
ncbi:5'/3'-nucleotidase SurE [Leptolyngbya sp. FACHB-711]|uniref:5'/3'-nucleotidase SurE n=1 Tax=unclassified Leptolyngbya TaxID=2650499 RepID=UPI001684B96A|nr:5'/3'-nucleotidase SurE [Leptolyngbya sp. FACHB-711]MBD1850419.1 5'/3'-nucleotidase SurE [Cyanobacteria bacterium FACHB-502]MBD2026082.1 5'/3'-nucleotidase SurE [Leptolyngbya sp. FACHB-711]